MEVQIILLISIALQLAAAFFALRWARQNGLQRAWLLIAVAVVLMAGRRAVSLYDALDGTYAEQPRLAAELIALVTSVLMLAGIATIGPLLSALRHTRDELERHVGQRTADLRQVNAALQAEIAERARIAHALRGSEARYRAVVEDQTDLICRYLPDGTLTFVNGAYCRLVGATVETLIGQNFFEFVPQEDRVLIRQMLSLLTPNHPVLMAEHRLIGLDGEVWRQWTRQAIFDEQGRIVEIQAVGRDVLQQRRAEEALRESEAQMRLIVQNLPVMVDALDENGVFVMWNRECERVTGYSAEEMAGNPRGMELLYPDPDYLDRMQTVFTQIGGDFRDWEVTLTAKDGTERIIAWSNVSKQFPIPGWQTWAIGVDITRRKQTERALHEAHEALERRITERTAALRVANESLQREIAERQRAELALRASQAQLRMTVDALADAMHVVDRDLRITLHNEAFRQMNQELGLETRAIGRTPFELFPFLPDSVRDEYRQVFKTGEVLLTQETTTIGSLSLHTETRKIPVFDGDQVTHVVTVIRDTTEYKQAEQALRESEEKFRILVDSMDDIIFTLDTDQRHTGVYGRWIEKQGLTPESLLGKTAREVLGEEAAGVHEQANARALAGAHVVYEWSVPAGDDVLYYQTALSPIRDLEGRVAGLVGVGRDITDRKRAEQEALQLALEKGRSTILADFIQDISHEFANPLSVIKSRVYLALNTRAAARRRQHLDVVNGQVFHVEKLVEGLLTMSRLDGGFPFRNEPVSVNQVMQTIQANLESAAHEKNHTVIAELAADLPALMGDQKYLHLALRHLVDNAIRYTPPGGTITIRTAQRGEQAIVEVNDTGIGIAEEHQAAIFQRFFRVESARTERGAGLGLPIARAIIERHGGSIQVESTPGAGSTFRVFLPIGSC